MLLLRQPIEALQVHHIVDEVVHLRMIADVNERQRERHRVVRNASHEPTRAAPGGGDRPDAVSTLTPRGHGREVGAILIVLGVIALREGYQLYALREAPIAGAIDAAITTA